MQMAFRERPTVVEGLHYMIALLGWIVRYDISRSLGGVAIPNRIADI
jgi:hypothetical protein